MAIANYFYNETTRKYVAVFGTVFNQIKIERAKADGTVRQSIIVPLSYGPQQKFLARLQQDPNINRKSAITLPRMSFELLSMTFDPERKVGQTQKILKSSPESNQERNFTYVGAPYNLDFQLVIMTKYTEDAAKIMEQIIPFFQPDYTQTVKLIPDIDPIDIPIILTGVTTEELYEGNFEERRSVLYTLTFTMKGWYFGPSKKQKVIKFIDTNLYNGVEAGAPFLSGIDIKPGMDSQGNPISGRDGITASAQATIENGLVTAITVLNDGEKYDANNTINVTITAPNTVNATAIAVTSNTQISSINVTEGGGYYTSVPGVTISAPDAAFVNATATATLNANNEVASIDIVNAGTFYSSANVSISEPPARSSQIKFGDDALYHSSNTDVTSVGVLPSNLSSNPGYSIEFWLWPESTTLQKELSVIHADQFKIVYNANTGIMRYFPPFGGGTTSSPEALNFDEWNYVRFEHVGNKIQFGINDTMDAGGFPGGGTIAVSGDTIFAGDATAADSVGDAADESFIGYLDNLAINNIASLTTPGTISVPNTAITGSVLQQDFEKNTAAATANVVNGQLVSITITDTGSDYQSAPAVTITTPNATRADFQASAGATLTNGVVTGISVIDGGNFYDNVDVSIAAPNRVTATANAQVTASGDIGGITITNPGAGYRTAPTVTIGAPAATSVPYDQIEFDDDWGVLLNIVEE